MTERKRTYESKAKSAAVRRLAPLHTPVKPEDEVELDRQGSLDQTDKIDLLTRLIKHLKTL